MTTTAPHDQCHGAATLGAARAIMAATSCRASWLGWFLSGCCCGSSLGACDGACLGSCRLSHTCRGFVVLVGGFVGLVFGEIYGFQGVTL